MNNRSTQVLIIGAGLTGLTAAYLLKRKGMKAVLLEARDRLGGRIHTRYREGQASIELGATWLGTKHRELITLIEELGPQLYEQTLGETAIYEYLSTSPPQLVSLPPNNDPSYRIKGGSTILIDTLANYLDSHQVHLAQKVQSIQEKNGGFEIQTDSRTFEANCVVSTLPPALLANTIDIVPSLPRELLDIAQQTHTWMGESIKVGLTFNTPFWKEINSSPTIFSNVGPVNEMYDHANAENTHYALKGFMNGSFHSTTKEERKTLLLAQLKKYYGEQVLDHISYVEKVWKEEPFTFFPYESSILPHQNNGHPIFQEAYLNGKFFVAGSETADQFPGYMDGAIRSAQYVVKQVLGTG